MTEPVKATRRCGDCTACCTVMAVVELEKPMRAKCPHICSRGCRIYQTRPDSCRTWFCAWALGHLPRDWKPNKIGMLIDIGQGKDWTAHVTPGTTDEAWRRTYISLGLKAVAKDGLIIRTLSAKSQGVFMDGKYMDLNTEK